MNREIAEVAYEPPEPTFNDTILAFRAMTGPHMAVTITEDSLGPVNKCIRLTRNGKPVGRAVLYPVNAGSTVSIEHATGHPGHWGGHYASPSWCVKVNDKRVLEIPESDLQPKPTPPKVLPWRSRVRTATKRRLRAWMDAGVLRIGYSPSNETSGDD